MDEQFKFFECLGEHGLTIRGSIHQSNRDHQPWFIICHGLTNHRIGPGYLFVKLSRYLSSLGFSSVRFDFCGSGESDGDFKDMSIDSMQSDLLTVTSMIRTQYKPDYIVIIGHSFGGMIAALSTPKVISDGLILIAPVGDPQKIISKRKLFVENSNRNDGIVELGPHEMKIESFYSLLSIDPVKTLSQNFKGNLLLIQGDNDQSISVEESLKYVESAKESGINTEYQLLKGTDHNFSKVSDIQMLYQVISSWSKERFL